MRRSFVHWRKVRIDGSLPDGENAAGPKTNDIDELTGHGGNYL
jgi:hypothetical protein